MENLEKVNEAFEKAFKDEDAGHYEYWLRVADCLLDWYLKGNSARHHTAEDVVREIVLKFLSGVYTWDMEKYPDIDINMKIRIKWYILNLKTTNKKEFVMPEYNYDDDGEEIQFLDKNQHLTLEEILQVEEREELRSIIRKEIDDDTECALVYMEILNGKQTKDIAEEYKRPPDEINKYKKRLRNKIKKALNKYNYPGVADEEQSVT